MILLACTECTEHWSTKPQWFLLRLSFKLFMVFYFPDFHWSYTPLVDHLHLLPLLILLNTHPFHLSNPSHKRKYVGFVLPGIPSIPWFTIFGLFICAFHSSLYKEFSILQISMFQELSETLFHPFLHPRCHSERLHFLPSGTDAMLHLGQILQQHSMFRAQETVE